MGVFDSGRISGVTGALRQRLYQRDRGNMARAAIGRLPNRESNYYWNLFGN